MTLAQAIADYHALLDPALAAASWQRLTEEMRARQLYFGERPLATVLRPRLMTASQYDLLRRGTQQVAEAARAIVAAAFEHNETGQAVRDTLMLTPLEERLIAMHPGYLEPSAHSRMDTFLTVDGSSLQFVEYNAESPAAIAYEDLLAQAFLAMPVMEEFAKRYSLMPLPARPYMLRTLMDCWRAAGSPGQEPQVAIVDWRGVPTATEFEMFRRYFNEHGLPAVICAPQDLAFHDGQLWARLEDGSETPVTIVFKRVLTSEFLTHYGDDALSHPLVQAYAAGACVIVNSFRAKLLHKKSLFALLSDERFHDPLSAEQRAAVAAHVPWTRVVRSGQTTYQGETIDLLAFARANRERLVLKPNDEYGGKGITIGWEASAAEWDAALNAALASPFVVQERVTIAYEPYPALVDGQVVIGERLVDSDPFLFGTEVNGCLCRLSTVTLLNVTAGGGSTVPVFVIDG
ncbi:circularly permuted type 2 ATP-grasp protein [uncultured Chloroflexus sp.]|uniref:circularly permuted type 2 ATP-grasp protein n=1 Tax=uncultured Chloroflexus sp. TaxID=214040 RepID=UPI0026396921|nr:circularly permuted type 2 ATP-grasp protein [uncultured Chloroflexus sp.]